MAEMDDEQHVSLDDADCPALFLCKSCRMPLAESLDVSMLLPSDDVILLKAVTEHVLIDKNKKVSSFEVDLYSTVQVLNCKGCYAVVGALYVATPIILDFKRDLFQLNMHVLTCYGLNHRKQRMDAEFQKLVTFPYMERQLKKCRTIYGFCERALTEMEVTLASRRL